MSAIVSPQGTEENSIRLPRNIEPVKYILALSPDLRSATFTGTVTIVVKAITPTDRFVLNAAELKIKKAGLRGKSGSYSKCTAKLDDESERLTIELPHTIAPGEWELEIEFSGVLNDKLRGFYKSTFTGADGKPHTIATTQFEATDARRAFPCWDEPDRKASFVVSLDVDAGLTAISNGAQTEVENLGNGKKRVHFEETMVMSTYLVAFVVGPLVVSESVDAGGVALRVAHVPGKENLTSFALECGAHALRFFKEWFGIPYPGSKLDLIAIPDFAFGAMENFGAVTFRETALLVDPELASRVELERVADVVSHEIAHMWFGDLVTMKWWNGLWLNEAFATFAEMACVDAFKPEWNRWVTFGLTKGTALGVDSLSSTRPIEFPVNRPEEAQGMFDVLTYEKGAGVLRMLEMYLGSEKFIGGIRKYLATHSYGNAETTDLWDAIEEFSKQPVRSVMDTWIFQGGYPLVVAEAGDDGAELRVSQKPFRSIPKEALGAAPDAIGDRWKVPVVVECHGGGGASENLEHRELLEADSVSLPLPSGHSFSVVNAGGWGFYRVGYGENLLEAISSNLSQLKPLERFNLFGDMWAMALAGETSLASYLRLAAKIGIERDPNVWSQVAGSLGMIDHISTGTARTKLQEFVRAIVKPSINAVGIHPNAGEDPMTGTLRAVLFRTLGVIGADEEVVALAREMHDSYLLERNSVPPDLAGAITSVVAAHGTAKEYKQFVERYRSPANPQEEVRYLFALVGFEDPELFKKTLEAARTEVRTQNAPFLIQAALASRTGGATAWDFVATHWEELLTKFPEGMIPRMLDSVSSLCEKELAATVRAFLSDHKLKTGQRTLDQALERLEMNLRFVERETVNLESSLVESLGG